MDITRIMALLDEGCHVHIAGDVADTANYTGDVDTVVVIVVTTIVVVIYVGQLVVRKVLDCAWTTIYGNVTAVGHVHEGHLEGCRSIGSYVCNHTTHTHRLGAAVCIIRNTDNVEYDVTAVRCIVNVVPDTARHTADAQTVVVDCRKTIRVDVTRVHSVAYVVGEARTASHIHLTVGNRTHEGYITAILQIIERAVVRTVVRVALTATDRRVTRARTIERYVTCVGEARHGLTGRRVTAEAATHKESSHEVGLKLHVTVVLEVRDYLGRV